MRIFLTAWLTLMAFSVCADIEIDPQNIGEEKITQPAKRSPYSFDTHLDVVGKSKINNGFYKKDKVEYAEAEAEGGMIFYYCPEYTEGARVAVGYFPVYLRWQGNPWFDQDHFNFVSFTLSGFTKRLDRWFWRGQLTANFDAEEWSGKYTSYDLLLWGRYALCQDIGIHFGFLAETGLRMDRVYPILGFDWQICRNLKLNLIFPVNVSLMYNFARHWSVGVAGRLFNTRFRVHHDQHSHKPLVRYTNVGAEFVIQYETDSMTANIHAGSTLDGTLRIADHSNNHAKHYYLDASGYIGAEVDVKF